MTPAQSAGLEQRARELLAAEYKAAGRVYLGDAIAIRAIVAALSAPAADGWRPIESAPEGGEVVLLCDAYGNRWSDCSPGVPANGCGYPAILWQPLPAAPQSQGEGGGDV